MADNGIAPQARATGDVRDRALLEAASNGDAAAVKRLLADGAKVDVAGAKGVTPLIAASYRNRVDAAKVLLEAGAAVDHKDATQLNALLIASSDGFVELLALVRRHGADLEARDAEDNTALIRAADRTQDTILRELLQTGISRNHVNRIGMTALHGALINGLGGDRLYESVRLLIENGADPNIADANGDTALALAQRRGLADIVHLIEANGGR